MGDFFTEAEAESVIGKQVRCLSDHRAEPDNPGDVRQGDLGKVCVAEPVRGSLGAGYMIVIDWAVPSQACGSYLIAAIGSDIELLDGTVVESFKGMELLPAGDYGPIHDDDVPF